VAFLFEAVKLTWKRQQQEQKHQTLRERQQVLEQQVREQQLVPVRVQEQLLPSCHKRPKQQQQR
jgi:hypothetical protein